MNDIPFGLVLFLLFFIVPAIWGWISKSDTVRRRLNLPARPPEQEAPRPRPRRPNAARPTRPPEPRPTRPPEPQRRQGIERIAEETSRSLEEVEWRGSRDVPRPRPILPPRRPAPRPPLLATRAGLRQAILMQEILGPPKALRDGASPDGRMSSEGR